MAITSTSTQITVVACQTGRGTITLTESQDVICVHVLDGVHFDFDFSFVRPSGITALFKIVADINQETDKKVLIAGHTDRVGLNAYNEALSRRRARSVLAYVSQDVAAWMELLRTMLASPSSDTTPRTGSGQSFDRWQTREIQYMLFVILNPSHVSYFMGNPDNVFTPALQSALDAFRADNGLPAGGGSGRRWAGVDEDTWQKMFEKYMDQQGRTHIDSSRFLTPAMLGCGEKFPRNETRAPGTENQDLVDAQARDETNRRVEFVLFPPAMIPNPLDCDAVFKDSKNTITICPAPPQPITVVLHFTVGSSDTPMTGMAVTVTGQGGLATNFTTDQNGKVSLPSGTTQGDFRVRVPQNFKAELRDSGLGTSQGNEIQLHISGSVTVEIMVTALSQNLQIRLLDDRDKPLANMAYVLTVGSQGLTGTTDANGVLQQPIPAGATTARLVLPKKLFHTFDASGAVQQIQSWGIDLQIADLPPTDQVAGAKARLNNLGFFAGSAVDGNLDEQMARALRRFQAVNGLPDSGTLDDATRQKLKEIYGS